jgi:hypothetical protein
VNLARGFALTKKWESPTPSKVETWEPHSCRRKAGDTPQPPPSTPHIAPVTGPHIVLWDLGWFLCQGKHAGRRSAESPAPPRAQGYHGGVTQKTNRKDQPKRKYC